MNKKFFLIWKKTTRQNHELVISNFVSVREEKERNTTFISLITFNILSLKSFEKKLIERDFLFIFLALFTDVTLFSRIHSENQ